MAKESEMKLLGTPASTFVNRVQFVLNLKSIEYKFIQENLFCKSELLLTSNPVHKKVPVLIHGNKPPIPESLIIIEYLDELYPDTHPVLPSDPFDRADHRFWASYIDNKFYPLYEELRRSPEDGKEAIKKQIIEKSQVLEEAFVKISNGKDYFGGDDIGYLDVVLGCFIGWISIFEKLHKFKVFDEATTPRLQEWVKCICSHKAIKSNIPTQETLTNIYLLLQKYNP
uniref:glutathione S-transferase U17-like n=1 Tax=Erigeron canadensis TaxID=72917 RepID=UPI001CB93447|nr:glutathione S-transferase U17-like [Erigeron canadensis]